MPIYPLGNNKMGSYYSFTERILYDSVSHMGLYFENDQLNLRELSLFGKVDTKGEQIILPRKKYLQNSGLLTTVDNKGEHFMLSVFAEPFIKLRERFSHLFNRDFITEKSLFVGLEPKKSLVFWEDDYSEHLKEISDDFYKYFKKHSDKNKVADFRSFIKMFEMYVADRCPYTTFTLKNYMISRFCDPLASGMMIELASADASDDASKYVDYINDPNYAKFLNEAAYYGFIADKHVPWRLIVNPNSEYIQKSLEKNGFTSLQEMFSEIYIDPTMLGFEMFLIMLSRMYETIVMKNPQYPVLDYSTGTASTSIKFREKVKFKNPKKIMEKMGDTLTLKLYTFLRAREKNIDLSQSQFDSITKKALDFKKQVDLKNAIVYIDNQTMEGSTSAQKPNFRI